MITRGDAISGATFSDCMRYRYSLWRTWDKTRPRMAWCLLNPSTADEHALDPTLSRCRRRALGWGFGAMTVVNIFALRSTDPHKLYDAKDPVGPDNAHYIMEACENSTLLVCGWGTHGALNGRGTYVLQRICSLSAIRPHHLGLTISGHPKHPLYLPYTVKPEPFRMAVARG